MAVRVVVGDDEPLVREGIVRVLEQAEFDVVGVAGDAPDLLRKTGAHTSPMWWSPTSRCRPIRQTMG